MFVCKSKNILLGREVRTILMTKHLPLALYRLHLGSILEGFIAIVKIRILTNSLMGFLRV